MNEKRTPIAGGNFPLEVDPNAVYQRVGELETKQKDNEDTMRAVIIILMVMVGTMIFTLQIALTQSKQPSEINIHLVK